LTVLPILSRFDRGEELAEADQWLNRFSEELKPFYDDWLPERFKPQQIIELTKVPYVTLFSFGEKLPVLSHGTSEPQLPGYYYRNLARLLESDFQDAASIIDPANVAVRPQALEELVIELTDLKLQKSDGFSRPTARARLIYEPASTGQREVVSEQSWRLIAPLGPIEVEELRWYLESWPVWPNPLIADRARRVEASLVHWGQLLHAAAMPEAQTANIINAWAKTGKQAGARFSIYVDTSLEAGASEEDWVNAKESAKLLLGLPWELLHNGSSFLFQGPNPTSVRRRLPNMRTLAVAVMAPPIRVLLITARPEDETCSFLDHRASALPLVAATEELGDVLRLTLLHPATYPALQAELARAQQVGESYHVVHFDGHGVYDRRVGLGGLCFEDPSDSHKLTGRRHQTVYTNQLGPLLNNYRIPLVLLEACQSANAEAGAESVASELLQRGVASVVAMSHSVLVETARRFVAAFYAELAKGQRVGQAMLAGQRALHSDPSRGQRYGIGELTLADWFVPVLYQEKDDPQLFTATPAPQTKEDLRARLRARLGEVPPEPAETGFVGRSRDLLALERLLRQERWSVLRGQGGEGKTALAAELARWLVRSQQVRRAAFVSMELCSHKDAVLNALGRQLVGADYSAAKYEDPEQALLPIERALREQPCLLVIDHMESVLLPPYLETPDLLSEEAALELQAILALAERLLRAGETRIVFTSREALPAPFAASRQLLELRQLGKADAVALIERSLAAGEGSTATGPGAGAAALEARREEIEALVDTVQGHALSLALLAPELRRRGVAATHAALVEPIEQMQRQVTHLPEDDPHRREQSLFAYVEASLRRLSTAIRERARVLGVFHGGVNLAVLQAMTRWDPAEVKELARELVGTGLATANPYNHLALNPALCPYLQASLREEERQALTAGWLEAMAAYLGYLVQQQNQNPELAATLTLLELPNLYALLDRSQASADPATTIDRATSLYSLLQMLGKPRLLERVAHVREDAAAALGEGLSHAHFQASRTRIEQQLAAGQMRDAMAGAQQLLQQAQAAGEVAYAEAEYDLAMAFFLGGRVLQKGGGAERALPLLQEAGRRFEAIVHKSPGVGAEGMVSACLTEQGNCLLTLGRCDATAAVYRESIRRDEQRGAIRDVAVSKGQLGIVHLYQRRYAEALETYQQARNTFSRLNEPGSIAIIWHQVGRVHEEAGQPEAAEEAYNQSLAIKVRLGDQAGQASTLGQLGNLYDDVLQRPEEAVAFYQRAAEICGAIGDTWGEGRQWSNLANTLFKLQHLEEARQVIRRAIECKAPFGHAAEPWTSLAILAAIETAAGKGAAAADARHKAINAYLSYRHDGGENQSGSGRLAHAVRQALASDDPAEVAFSLQQLAADPAWAEHIPFLTALQAISAGSRDRSLAENPGLTYDQAAEVLLLIEALQGPEAGAGS
jgi:tetratricopeptide (TPR) repeat protein